MIDWSIINWWLIDEGLMNNVWLMVDDWLLIIFDWLMIDWWFIADWLNISCWLWTDWLMIC